MFIQKWHHFNVSIFRELRSIRLKRHLECLHRRVAVQKYHPEILGSQCVHNVALLQYHHNTTTLYYHVTLCYPLYSTLKSFALVNWSAFIKVTVLCTAFALPFRVQVCTYSIQSCAELLYWTAQMHYSILEIIPLYCPTTQTLQCTAVELWISSSVALRGPSLPRSRALQHSSSSHLIALCI